MRPRIKAFLFDLDDTLLSNDMEGAFLQRYLDMLSRKVALVLEPETVVPLLWRCSEAMVRNEDSSRTLKQVFWDEFASRTNIPEATLMPLLMDFYANDFPALEDETQRIPEARPLIKTAFGRGCDVVIATKPVFPRVAIAHRLAWAGIDDFDYSLITSYEVMHFCKPHPQYFLEISRFLGLQPEECMMIGNDPSDDMAAGKVGMRTFYIEGTRADSHDLSVPVNGRGSARRLLQLLESEEIHGL